VLAALCAIQGAVATSAEPPTVFAAASLTDAVETIAAAYRSRTGVTIRLAIASSSTLARQIEAGAPADIFLSANEAWMDDLAAQNLIDTTTRVNPIGNRLALIVPADRPNIASVDDPVRDLPALLGPEGRLAVGDPDHVPAGIYARQALQSLGLWQSLEFRLARTDDVRAALALVASGEAPLGIVYATDAAITENVRIVGLLPADSHDPIRYPFAVLAGRNSAPVAAFFAYLIGPDGLAVFEQFGFTIND